MRAFASSRASFIGTIALTILGAADVNAQELLLFGGRNHETFLGCLTCSRYESSSVSNRYGDFGSRYSDTSIFNRYSDFGSRYSDYSACNQYASDPPVIVDREGNYYGRLTINRYGDPIRNAEIIAWLTRVCSD